MTRLLPAVLAGLCCGVAGVRYASLLRRQASELARWETLLRHLSLLLREACCTLPECLEHAAANTSGPDETLRSLAARQRAMPLTPLEALYQPGQTPEADIVRRCLMRISSGNAEERSLAASQAADEIRLLAQSATVRAAADAKMWASLGWTVGASLMLLLL